MFNALGEAVQMVSLQKKKQK